MEDKRKSDSVSLDGKIFRVETYDENVYLEWDELTDGQDSNATLTPHEAYKLGLMLVLRAKQAERNSKASKDTDKTAGQKG